MKKLFIIFLCLYVFISSPFYSNQLYIFAETSQESLEEQISENIDELLVNLDTTKINELLESIIDENNQLFKNKNFKDKIKDIASGDLSLNANSLGSHVGSVFVQDILSFLPMICLIIAIAVLYSILATVSVKNKSLIDIIHFVCYGAIVVIIISSLANIIGIATSTIGTMRTQMDAVFPILLTMLTALGGTSSVGIYQPAMAVLSGTVVSIFTNILIPIFIFKMVFTIISNLTTNIKFSKFADFFGSSFKWLLGIVLTVFSAFVSIQGLMAGSIDGVSIKTAKYTIKSGIPLIGGFLSDGMGLIMVSTSLIKNAVGMGGLILLFSSIIAPTIKILVFSFSLKLVTAILEPISDSRITNFMGIISKSIPMLIALILGVAFMFFIITGLVMCSANIF